MNGGLKIGDGLVTKSARGATIQYTPVQLRGKFNTPDTKFDANIISYNVEIFISPKYHCG